MASYGEEGGECGVDEELSRDVQSLQAVLAGEGGDSEHTGHESEGGEEGEGGGCATSAVIGLRECLRKNHNLQVVLMKQLKRLNLALIDNKAKQARLAFIPRVRKRRALNMWRFSRGCYFKDFKGRSPPVTADVRHPREGGPENFYTREGSWRQDREEKRLSDGVVHQNTNLRMLEIQKLIERAANSEEAKQLKEQLKEVKQLPPEDLMKDISLIDWDLLAFEQFSGAHSSRDCQLHWENYQCPSLHRGPWTKEEDKQLLRLAKNKKYHDWQAIADELKPNRSAFTCLQRYQQSLNPHMFRSGWTDEEDAALREAVAKYGQKNWKAVSTYIGQNRTPQQCLHRWYNSLHPSIKKGRWVKEEDEQLREAVKQFGAGNWSKVSQLVPSRTSVQCRERWVNVLDEKIKRGSWDKEEETRLKQLCEKYEELGTIPWCKVAAELGNRTDYQCAKQWRQLSTTGEVVSQYASRVKKRESIMNNFHGRRKQRSSLSAIDLEDDLIPETTKEKLKSYHDKITQQKLRQAGVVTKKSPYKPVADKSDTIPPRERDTALEPVQQQSATESQDATEVGDMDVGVAEAAQPKGRPRKKRRFRGRRGKGRKKSQSSVDNENVTLSTESALPVTSQSIASSEPMSSLPTHSSSEPGPSLLAQSGSESRTSLLAHSGSEPGPSLLPQTALTSATAPITLRTSTTPPLYTLAPTTTTVTQSLLPPAAQHDNMYDQAMAYLRNFESGAQGSGSVLLTSQNPHSEMGITAPATGRDASTTESPITAVVQALLDIRNVPPHPPAASSPSSTTETVSASHHHLNVTAPESPDSDTSGGATGPVSAVISHGAQTTWCSKAGAVVPREQPLSSAVDDILKDSATEISIIDMWSNGQLVLSPPVQREDISQLQESMTTGTYSQYTTPMTATSVTETYMPQMPQMTASPFPPRMLLYVPTDHENISSATSAITLMGSNCLPPFMGPRTFPSSPSVPEPQTPNTLAVETSSFVTGEKPLVVQEAEFLSEHNELFLVLLENPAFKSRRKRRPTRRVDVREVRGVGERSSEANRERDKTESENMEVSEPRNDRKSDDNIDDANEDDDSLLPEEMPISKRPRVESSDVGSTTESIPPPTQGGNLPHSTEQPTEATLPSVVGSEAFISSAEGNSPQPGSPLHTPPPGSLHVGSTWLNSTQPGTHQMESVQDPEDSVAQILGADKSESSSTSPKLTSSEQLDQPIPESDEANESVNQPAQRKRRMKTRSTRAKSHRFLKRKGRNSNPQSAKKSSSTPAVKAVTKTGKKQGT